MDDRIERALAITPQSSASARTIDITTTGARSGLKRRIEIWFYRVDDEIYLTTQPARRDWSANLRAHPQFVFHLKNGAHADIPARAEPVSDPAARRHIFDSIIDDLNQPRHSAYIAQPVEGREQWMRGSPLMRVRFDDLDEGSEGNR